jgi:hypothetical protein
MLTEEIAAVVPVLQSYNDDYPARADRREPSHMRAGKYEGL